MADTEGRARRLHAEQTRARLIEDARLRARLVRDYQPVWQRIVAQLRLLSADMQAARRAGVTIDRAWVEEWARRHRLERTVREAVGRYVETAGPLVEDAAGRAAVAGATDAQRLAIAVGVLDAGLPVEATAAIAAALRPGLPLRALLDELGPTAALRAREQLVAAVAAGLNPRAVAREMRNATAMSLARALRIARTETIGAYRRAALARFREQRDVIGGWVWLAKLDGRTCAACVAMHGTVHPLDEDMASHPNCRCVPAPLTGSWGVPGVTDTRFAPETGPEWFARQPRGTQLAILGPGKLAAYETGRLRIEELAQPTLHPVWGPGLRERALRDVLAAGGV